MKSAQTRLRAGGIRSAARRSRSADKELPAIMVAPTRRATARTLQSDRKMSRRRSILSRAGICTVHHETALRSDDPVVRSNT